MAIYFIRYEMYDSDQEQETYFEAPNRNIAIDMFVRWAAQYDESWFAYSPVLFDELDCEVIELNQIVA